MSKIIVCKWIPRRFCVNLFGTIWTRDPSWIGTRIINHEKIHTAQQRELLFIPFYMLYGLEWLLRLIQFRHWYKAYENISFEREAYAHDSDPGYLGRRKHYAQWRKNAENARFHR